MIFAEILEEKHRVLLRELHQMLMSCHIVVTFSEDYYSKYFPSV